MQNYGLFLSILGGVSIFLTFIAVATLIYQRSIKYTKTFRENNKDWLFYKFGMDMFETIFGEKNPVDMALKLGIDVEEYNSICRIVGVEPDIEGIIMDYIYGIVLFFIFVIFAIIFHPFFIIGGLILMYLMIKLRRNQLKAKAEEKKQQIRSEFPRFIGLLSTELAVGIPIDIAIEKLSRKYDALISKEFLNSLNDVKLGAVGWQTALYDISAKYRIDDFSDFVMDVTTAFNKGTSIAEAVAERSRELKSKRLYEVKERAARAENMILIPIALFQFVPMIAYTLLPTITSIRLL